MPLPRAPVPGAPPGAGACAPAECAAMATKMAARNALTCRRFIVGTLRSLDVGEARTAGFVPETLTPSRVLSMSSRTPWEEGSSVIDDPQRPVGGTAPPATGRGRYDVAVIGGGIVGLATAREILRRAPGSHVALLEKEREIARHQTGHNSGVIHTGVYYRPGSLKARLCVEGRAAMLRFCEENGIPYQVTGKLIVAVEESERARLEELRARGTANGAEGLELL